MSVKQTLLGTIKGFSISIEFASKFPDEIKNKKQLQRFLGSLNYISEYYKDIAFDTRTLYERLRKNPAPWTVAHTEAIQRIKLKAKQLLCLSLAHPNEMKIVETESIPNSKRVLRVPHRRERKGFSIKVMLKVISTFRVTNGWF